MAIFVAMVLDGARDQFRVLVRRHQALKQRKLHPLPEVLADLRHLAQPTLTVTGMMGQLQQLSRSPRSYIDP